MQEKALDRRVRKTRRQIRLGLTELMQEKPIKDISVRELAERVDINRGTFYIHYKDIYDLLEKLEAELFETFYQILNSHTPQEIREKPLSCLVDIFRFLSDNLDLCRALLGPHGDIAFIDRLKGVVRTKFLHDWMEIYNKQDASLFAYYDAFMVSGCVGLLNEWLANDTRESPEQMAALAEKMILNGIQVLG